MHISTRDEEEHAKTVEVLTYASTRGINICAMIVEANLYVLIREIKIYAKHAMGEDNEDSYAPILA